MSRYEREWKNAKVVDEQLAKFKSENQKRTALELQIRHHKYILLAHEISPTEKKKLLKISKVPLNELKNNLKEILTLSPHLEHDLQDIDQETIKITGRTILSNEQRQHLFEKRVTALNNQLKIQREKIDKKNETSDNCTENTDEEAA